jgi:hypothetical protein
MNRAVLYVGLIAATLSAVGGALTKREMEQLNARNADVLERVEKEMADPLTRALSRRDMAADYETLSRGLWLETVIPNLLFVGAGLGVLGAILGFTRRRFGAAAVLLAAAVGPVLFAPIMVVFSGLLAVTALLALFVGSAPAPELTD